jgi:hypothetical protein
MSGILLSFPNTGGSSFSATTVSTTVHSQKALEQYGSESLFLTIYNYFSISVKKIKNYVLIRLASNFVKAYEGKN